MKIFIDIGHPAHVHYFRNFYFEMLDKGHDIFITARSKDISLELLRSYSIPYVSRGKGAVKTVGKILYIFKADFLLLKYARKFKPDIFLSFGSPYCAQVAYLMRKPHIAIDDTENANLGQLLYRPFSSSILSPTSFSKDFGRKHLKFPSFMELAYLHPKRFKPDESILNMLGVKKGEKYMIVRFVGWGAVHDYGHSGISKINKIKIINSFSEHARVFITSELELPDELKKFRLDIPIDKIHDALAFSTLFYGESATMASEAAVLGTPSIYLDNEGRGYTNEQEEEYGLVFNFSESEKDQERSIKKGIEILTGRENSWKLKRDKLLRDKIDLTEYLIWFVENYPDSQHKEFISKKTMNEC